MSKLLQAARRVKQSFKKLSIAISDQSAANHLTKALQDEEQNFTLWAVNLGVFDAGHSSLDYRLQDVSEASDLVRGLLIDLTEHLDGLYAIRDDLLRGSETLQSPKKVSRVDLDLSHEMDDSDSSDDDMDEVDAHILSVSDIILRLFRIARSIRNYSTRSAQGRRNIYSTIPSDERQTVQAQLFNIERGRVTDLITHLRKTEYDGLIDSDETIDLNEDDYSLIARFATAGSRRRQQFVYWRMRHERSLHAVGDAEEDEEEGFSDNVPAPHLDHLLAGDRVARPQSIPSSVTRLRRDQVDLAERRSAASDISRAPSARGPSGEKPGWPSIPDGLSAGQYFECPFCFHFCPDRYRSDQGWKAHLIHDLKPYCCTYPSCESGDQLYESWADWSTHEMLVHNKVWVCLEHPDTEFASLQEYRTHVQSEHADEALFMLTTEVAGARVTGSSRSNRHCPFCLSEMLESQDLQHHIAWHLESMALTALPRSTGHEQGSEERDLRSDVQRADGLDSRVGDVTDMPLPREDEVHPGEATEIDPETMERLTKEVTANVLQQLKEREGADENASVDVNQDQDPAEEGEDVEDSEDESSGTADDMELDSLSPLNSQHLLHWMKSSGLLWAMSLQAKHLIDDYEPKGSIVISPGKMQLFYLRHQIREEKYPWQAIMDDRTSSISRLFREFEIEHHLIQHEPSERPDVPSLTPRGFIAWMHLTMRIDPLSERQRWHESILPLLSLSKNLTKSKKLRLSRIHTRLPEFSRDTEDRLESTKFAQAIEKHCNLLLEPER